MRLIFTENKQRELINREKEHFNLSFVKLAINLGITESQLKAYYYDGVLLPEDIFEKFSNKEKFRKNILGIKQENWGQSKGGKSPKAGYIKEITSPPESEYLAEFYGIMLGDGNLTKIKSYKVGTYQIRIVGDSRNDKEYLINYVKPLIEKLFEVKVNLYKIKDQNAINVNAHGLKLVEFLESKGFKPGDKIQNQLTIPDWIKENDIYLKACLRGLYDTDGCVYKLTNQNSHQICFTNYNKKLLVDVRNSLIYLGINVSQITRNRDIMITKKSELRKFLKDIGFSNIKHLNKVKMWKLAS